MKRKKFTRRTAWLFKDGFKKGPLPPAYFKTEDDLYEALIEWFDYHDPIGFVRNWGIYREYEPQTEDLSLRVQRCKSVEEFAGELRKSLAYWFDVDDVKPHFVRRSFRAVAEEGWALWRRFEFDMKRHPAWETSQAKLAKFRPPNLDGAPRVVIHRLVNADDIECLFEKRPFSEARGTLNFLATDVTLLSDAQVIQKAHSTGLIAADADVWVSRYEPNFVSVSFNKIAPLRLTNLSIQNDPRSKKLITGAGLLESTKKLIIERAVLLEALKKI